MSEPDEIDRECPVCGKRKPLRFFRRWRGSKKVLHFDCNACGEVTLSSMRPAERQQMLQKQNVSTAVIERLNARDKVARANKMHSVQRVLHSGRRKRQWEHALGTRLRSERDWVRRNMLALPPDAVGWHEFFKDYNNVLTDMIARYVAVYNRSGSPTMPTVNDAHPLTYVYPESMVKLRKRYAECRPIRGRRLFRDPWFLEWDEYVPMLTTEKERGLR